MKHNQNGFALAEILIALIVLAVISMGGYMVWQNRKATTPSHKASAPTSAQKNFDECVTEANKVHSGATLDSSGTTLTCFWRDSNQPSTSPALAPIKTISATFTRLTWADLPNDIKHWVLNSSSFKNKDCESRTVTASSSTNNAVRGLRAGDYIKLAVGCDGATTTHFKLSDSKWQPDIYDEQGSYRSCHYIESRQLPIELLTHTFDPKLDAQQLQAPRCIDDKFIERQVTT